MELPDYDDNNRLEGFDEVEDPLGKNINAEVDRSRDADTYSELGSQASRQAVQKHKALASNKEKKPIDNDDNEDAKSDITEVTENKTPCKKKKSLPYKEIKSQLKMAMVQLARSNFQVDEIVENVDNPFVVSIRNLLGK
eukprot:13747710-Ditylum_brightwellii.AAC.1